MKVVRFGELSVRGEWRTGLQGGELRLGSQFQSWLALFIYYLLRKRETERQGISESGPEREGERERSRAHAHQMQDLNSQTMKS